MGNSSNEISRSLINIATITQATVEKLINGEVDPLSFATNIAKLEKVIKSIKENKLVTDIILSELDNYPRGTILNGMEITQIEAGTKYNYTQCGDVKLLELYNEQSKLEEKIKERESFLKGLKALTIIVEQETGEIFNLYPPQKTSKTTYKTVEVKNKVQKH